MSFIRHALKNYRVLPNGVKPETTFSSPNALPLAIDRRLVRLQYSDYIMRESNVTLNIVVCGLFGTTVLSSIHLKNEPLQEDNDQD